LLLQAIVSTIFPKEKTDDYSYQKDKHEEYRHLDRLLHHVLRGADSGGKEQRHQSLLDTIHKRIRRKSPELST
jgi:hypothetical protein